MDDEGRSCGVVARWDWFWLDGYEPGQTAFVKALPDDMGGDWTGCSLSRDALFAAVDGHTRFGFPGVHCCGCSRGFDSGCVLGHSKLATTFARLCEDRVRTALFTFVEPSCRLQGAGLGCLVALSGHIAPCKKGARY
jgi:hypothetical protein